MPRGQNTQKGKQGFQRTSAGKNAPTPSLGETLPEPQAPISSSEMRKIRENGNWVTASPSRLFGYKKQTIPADVPTAVAYVDAGLKHYTESYPAHGLTGTLDIGNNLLNAMKKWQMDPEVADGYLYAYHQAVHQNDAAKIEKARQDILGYVEEMYVGTLCKYGLYGE